MSSSSSEPSAQSSGDTSLIPPEGPPRPPCPFFLGHDSGSNEHESRMRSETTPAQRSALGPHHDKTVFTAPDVGLPILDFEQATCPIPGISANTGTVSTTTALNANDAADPNSSNSDASHVMCRQHPQLRDFDVDPFPGHPLEFMQAIRPVDGRLCSSTNNLPAILPADSDSKRADTMQHALLPQHLAHPFNFCHTAIAIATCIRPTCHSDIGADTIASERPDTLDNASSSSSRCCCCHNTNSPITNSNSNFDNNASIIGFAHTFNADTATNNSNNSDNDATGFVNTACTLDTNDADSNNNSKRLNTTNKIRSDADTFEKRSTTPFILTVSNTPAPDNEPKHKCVHILPLGSNLRPSAGRTSAGQARRTAPSPSDGRDAPLPPTSESCKTTQPPCPIPLAPPLTSLAICSHISSENISYSQRTTSVTSITSEKLTRESQIQTSQEM